MPISKNSSPLYLPRRGRIWRIFKKYLATSISPEEGGHGEYLKSIYHYFIFLFFVIKIIFKTQII